MSDSALRTLTSLRRLRRLETDQARRELAEALLQETALTERAEAIGAEIAEARRMTGEFDRDAFMVWLARMTAERRRLADAVRTAEARTGEARSELANRRVAENAVETALAKVKSARAAELGRRDQMMLEDIARAIKRGSKG